MENCRQNKELIQIKSQLKVIRQEKFNKTLICFGLPNQPNESLMQLVTNEFKTRNIPVDDILFCKRKAQHLLNAKSSPITITYIYEDVKQQSLDTARKFFRSPKEGTDN